jgi:threonine aldolase
VPGKHLVACKVPARDISRYFDSVSVCLSKGLGAPVGSVLVGTKELVETARRWRKVAGGGWRQAGMLAAACIHSLDHHVDRLADDHARAERLANALRDVAGVKLVGQHTNMVFIDVPVQRLDAFKAHMDAAHIGLSIGYLPNIRMVTHLDIDDAGLDRAIAALRAFDA